MSLMTSSSSSSSSYGITIPSRCRYECRNYYPSRFIGGNLNHYEKGTIYERKKCTTCDFTIRVSDCPAADTRCRCCKFLFKRA